jgi:hypothetical protein
MPTNSSRVQSVARQRVAGELAALRSQVPTLDQQAELQRVADEREAQRLAEYEASRTPAASAADVTPVAPAPDRAPIDIRDPSNTVSNQLTGPARAPESWSDWSTRTANIEVVPSTPAPSPGVTYGESFGPSWSGSESGGGGRVDSGGGGGSFGEHSDPGSMGWAEGGLVTGRGAMPSRPGGLVVGPGGPTDDLVTDHLSNGEFVVPAEATARYLPMLEAMRTDSLEARDDAAGGSDPFGDPERYAALNGDTSGYDPSPLAPAAAGALTPDVITARMSALSPQEMQILGQGMGPEFAGVMMKILGPAYAAVVRGAMGGAPGMAAPGMAAPGGAARLSSIVA